MSEGAAIVVTEEVRVVADLVRLADNGCYYSAGDVSAFPECLRRVLAEPGNIGRFGRTSGEILEGKAVTGVASKVSQLLLMQTSTIA